MRALADSWERPGSRLHPQQRCAIRGSFLERQSDSCRRTRHRVFWNRMARVMVGPMNRLVLVTVLLVFLCVAAVLQWRRSTLRGSAESPLERSRTQVTDDPEDFRIKAWHYVSELDTELAQFETVFWEPNDTDSLRAWLSAEPNISSQRILEIGTGTGLIALTCAKLGAFSVLGTDINPAAVANAKYNSGHLGLGGQIEFRRVARDDPGPFSVVKKDELFDWIISNPPWEDQAVREVAAHALYDPGFALLDGILQESDRHLRPGGKLLLVFGARTAIKRILQQAPQLGWSVEVADERELEQLPEVFLPGMLLVLQRQH